MRGSLHWEKFLNTINYNKLTSEQVGEKYVQWLTTIPVRDIPPSYYWDYSGLNWWDHPKRMQFYIPDKPKRSCPYLKLEAWIFRFRYIFHQGFHKTQFPRIK